MCRRFLFFLLLISCLASPAAYASQAIDVLAKIFEAKSDAVVTIAVKTAQGDRLGSGFFISRDGRLVTNLHLVSGAQKVLIKLKNGQAFAPTEIINLDPAKDIAVLKIDRRTSKYFTMADSNGVGVGQRVSTIGSPQGLEGTISDGLISSIRVDSIGMKIFQISVPLSQGSSGGPLIDLNGDVIGITTASLKSGENLNFAVPINYVRILLKKPFDPGRNHSHPWLDRQRNPPQQILQVPPGAQTYVVQRGDSLYGIAKHKKTSVEAIVKLNNLKNTKLKTGQKLFLPK